MQVMSGAPEGLPQGLYSKVTRYRHKVFVEQLSWELKIQDEAELDHFDHPDTVYVVAQDDEANVFGCTRLLLAIRPHLRRELFSQLLNGFLPSCSSPDAWILSRFAAVDCNGQVLILGQFSSPVAIKLLQESILCIAAHASKRLITADVSRSTSAVSLRLTLQNVVH